MNAELGAAIRGVDKVQSAARGVAKSYMEDAARVIGMVALWEAAGELLSWEHTDEGRAISPPWAARREWRGIEPDLYPGRGNLAHRLDAAYRSLLKERRDGAGEPDRH